MPSSIFRWIWAFCVRRALAPRGRRLWLVLETEIWPNFLREAGGVRFRYFFVSGRISDRSFVRYQSYLGVFGFFLRPFLRNALSNATAFLMQSEKMRIACGRWAHLRIACGSAEI